MFVCYESKVSGHELYMSAWIPNLLAHPHIWDMEYHLGPF